MSRRRKPIGRCLLCLKEGPLTFEHNPPEASGNDKPVVKESFKTWLNGSGWTGKGEKQQRGSGDHTLCGKCNNDTGSWYGTDYAEWAKHGRAMLPRIPQAPFTDAGLLLFRLPQARPLRFIKQAVAMILSANSPEFTEKNPDLPKFVLDRNARGLPSAYQLYLSLLRGTIARSTGVGGQMRLDQGDFVVMSEVAHPPFGIMMTFLDSPAPQEFGRITDFVNYGYDERVDVDVLVPTGETYAPYPGDNRPESSFKHHRRS